MAFVRRPDLDILEEGVFESVFVEIISGSKAFIVGVIYRPPDSDMASFFHHMDAVLGKVKDKQCYLMGDLIKSEQHSATDKFLDGLNSSTILFS